MMNPITFVLNPDSHGPALTDLHEALLVFLDRGLFPFDDAARQEMIDLLKQERDANRYRDATRRLVGVFQEQRHLPFSGDVDEPTAAEMNHLLDEMGLLGGAPVQPAPAFLVRGQALTPQGAPIEGLLVQIFDRDLGPRRQPLGQPARTAAGGRFEIPYALADFAALDPDARADLIFTLQLGEAALDDFQVTRLFKDDAGGLLSEQAVTEEERMLGIPARPVEEVRIVVQGALPSAGPAEYDLVLQAVRPLLPENGSPADFDEERFRDVSFAARETGLERALIQALVDAFRMARSFAAGEIDPSVFYALARTRGVTDLLGLARFSQAALRLALQEAGAGAPPIIAPLAPPDKLDAILAALQTVLARSLPSYQPAPGAPSLSDLLGAALPAPADQSALWRAYAEHTGSPAEFWDALQAEPAFADPERLAQVQYTFQLGLLTQNNLPLMDAIRQRFPDVRQAGQLALELDTPEQWQALIEQAHIAPPEDTPGLPEERSANFAQALAGAVQLIQPTAAAANLVKRLPADTLQGAQPGVARLLAGAVPLGFDLATGRIDDLLAEHAPTLLEGVAEQDRPAVVAQARRVQRLFRLSSGPESLKTLLDSGIDSAHSLAQLSPRLALNMLAPSLGEAQAKSIYNQAIERTAAINSAYILLNDLVNGAHPSAVMNAAQQAQMQSGLAQTFPNYTALFGSLDMCDCEQCRSIHSAAAYLVDLLQFLDHSGPNAQGLTPLDVLIGNPAKNAAGLRPDLAHIQLSCENTNTPMPYVDLVNEVLESYVVFNQSLPLQTGPDGAPLLPPVPQPNESSPGVTAPELSANPENTRLQAYAALNEAVFPFTLPFNQPRTSLRLTLEQMGSSLHEVMTTFGTQSDETAARAIDSEALKLSNEEFSLLTGETFDGQAQPRPVSDVFGFPSPAAPVDSAWVAGSLPAGAQPHTDNDAWNFAPFNPAPPSGAGAHASAPAAGLHQHYFDSVPFAGQLSLGDEDVLFAELFIDPANPPEQVVLQWNDGTWEHRAYWGASKFPYGIEGSPSRRYMGPLPPTGQWLRLEVPVYYVGLAGRRISGQAFTLMGGAAAWGAAGVRTPAWDEQLAHAPVFLSRAGLAYVDLVELLRTRFINPAVPQGAALEFFERIPLSYDVLAALVSSNFAAPDPTVQAALDAAGITLPQLADWSAEHFASLGKMIVLDAPDSSCDLELTRLQHLDGTRLETDELNRLQRFMRLWRKLGWTPAELDGALQALQANDITPQCVRRLGQVVQVQAALNLPVPKLVCLWGAIPTTGSGALYQKLFLSKALQPKNTDFEAIDGQFLPASANFKIDAFIAPLLSALRLRAGDLDLIRLQAGLSGSQAPLTLASASVLYRYSLLARALKMSVKDLIDLQKNTGLQPFSRLPDPNAGFTDIDPARTLQFIRIAQDLGQTGVTPALLSYVLRRLDDAPAALVPAGAAALLDGLRDGLIRLALDTQPQDDPSGELTRARLGQLFPPEAAQALLDLAAGRAVYSAALAALPAALPPGKVTYDPSTRLLKAAGWLTDAEQTTLLSLSNIDAYQDAVKAIYQAPRDLLAESLAAGMEWPTALADLRPGVLEAPLAGPDGQPDPLLLAARFNAFQALLLPHLRAALSRALVKQTLSTALNLEPAITAMLLEGDGGLLPLTSAAGPQPAIADFLSCAGGGLSAAYFASENFTNPPAPQVDGPIDFHWPGRHAFSVRWQGYLLAPKTQLTRFRVRVGGGVFLSIGGQDIIDQWQDSPPVEYSGAIALEQGRWYPIKLEYFNHAEEALLQLRWEGADTPIQLVPAAYLYTSEQPAQHDARRQTFIRLHKSAALVNALKLTRPQLACLLNPALGAQLKLNDLPVDAAPPDPAALFQAWRPWNDFALLRQKLPNPDALLDVFHAAGAPAAQDALAQAAGMEPALVLEVAGSQGFKLADADYHDPHALLRLVVALQLAARTGAAPAELFAWAAPLPDLLAAHTAAQQARQALKAQYDEDAWPEISRPLTDLLRESQRQSLVAYLLPRLGFSEPDRLFEHVLIDVEMDPCMETSRIKQAISSVQLFIQRCRLNLVPQVSPAVIDSERWQWMQNYRVWEANRKVFLYPENWIEPELRLDKSPFFRELEAEMLQVDVNDETAEIALGHYLEKLDMVSQLLVCGLYLQTDFASDEEFESVLHVFGRTFANPRTFYYRRLVTVDPTLRYWTAWEKVPVDIQADEVLPLIWNRRLYLFWQVVTEKSSGSARTNLLRLGWTELRQGKWTSRQVTSVEEALPMDGGQTYRMDWAIYGDELTIYFATMSAPICYAPGYQFVNGDLVPSKGGTAAISRPLGSLTFRNYNGLVQHNARSNASINYIDGYLASTGSKRLEFNPVACADEAIPVFNRLPDTGFLHLFSPGSRPYTLNDPFFLQDGRRAYLVSPHTYGAPPTPHLGGLKDSVPYLPGVFDAPKKFDITKDLGRPLMQMAELRTSSNPWMGNRAALAAVDLHQVSAGLALPDAMDLHQVGAGLALPGQPEPEAAALPILKSTPYADIHSQMFDYGVLQPGKIFRRSTAGFQFETFFHPFSPEFQRRLNRSGIPGLLTLDSQRLDGIAPVYRFADVYQPAPTVASPYPAHNVDFSVSGAYSLYNWELFFHAPLFLAGRLSQNQRFEEAMRWYHYIFNPTTSNVADPAPERFWNVQPFRDTPPQRIEDMLKALHAGDANVLAQWRELERHPFQPHRVARLRLSAYQKTVVMKYIDNLVAWGDQLFRRDTIESINQATQMYTLAAALLGPRPMRVPRRGRSQPKTFAQLRPGLDQISQALADFENDLPYTGRATPTGGAPGELNGLLGVGRSFYFCIPQNEKLLGYWDTIADRLFKIRHCMNIEGVVRQLPLFEPPIDPALLVKAAAQGLDLGSVLSDLSAPLPYYRFNILLARALEMTAELRALGGSLLSALEKQDAEKLSALRASHEVELLNLTRQVKIQQLEEAKTSEQALQKSRDGILFRRDYYKNIAPRIGEETNQLNELSGAQELQGEAQSEESTASDITSYAPDISVGAIAGPTGSGATFSATAGRGNLVSYYQARSRDKSYQASIRTYHANLSSILGNWSRRSDEWKFQVSSAEKELAQIDKQLTAAAIRINIAERELDNLNRQIEQAQQVQEYLDSKFTSAELYQWMSGEISTVFMQCYQIAYDLAKKAERCYRFERGLASSDFIQFGAWDSQRKGLLSGERLYLQLKQMERAYHDGNRREYELTRHYSLLLNDPQALVQLKAQGVCEIELPEALFDSDYPGHYMRRIKTVSLTIPAVVGPYSGVNCTLTLLRDKTRINSLPGDAYAEREDQDDNRFITNWAGLQAIATSAGQNDSGLFELNFHDERYLPFEGGGAVSRWRIELSRDNNSFDVNSLTDIVLHLRYTAREGGARLKAAASAALAEAIGAEAARPLQRMFSLKHEFPNEWYQLTRTPAAAQASLRLTKERFPFLFRGKTLTAGKVRLFAVLKDGPAPNNPLTVHLTPPGAAEEAIALGPRPKWQGLLAAKQSPDVAAEIKASPDDAAWLVRTDSAAFAAAVEDLLVIVEYAVG